jgi:hypothetical protein
MGFRVISGTAIQEFVENVQSATAALDPVRQLYGIGIASSESPRAASRARYFLRARLRQLKRAFQGIHFCDPSSRPQQRRHCG